MRLAAALLLCAGVASAAAGARESWTGSYQCGPSSGGSAYSVRITMLIEDGKAQVTRESAQIKESMSGRVAADGTLRLEGTGVRKDDGAAWSYRFDGRIDGSRFDARGALLSSNRVSRLRECSMSLSKVQPTGSPPESAPAVTLKPSIETKPVPVPAAVAEAPSPKPAEPRAKGPRAAPGESVERELDVAGKSASATMEGSVFHGAPHRYLVSAERGQKLIATLKSKGARLDLYEPGATLTLLSTGFVVQGTRLGATPEGESLEIELPADGTYLLLVRSNGERAVYTLELKAERPPSTLEAWLSDERVWVPVVAALAVLGLLIVVRQKRDRRRNRRLFTSG